MGALDERLVLGGARELPEGIGRRLGGSESSHRARDYPADVQPFTYLGREYDFVPVPPEYHQPSDAPAIVVLTSRTIADVADGVAQALDRQR